MQADVQQLWGRGIQGSCTLTLDTYAWPHTYVATSGVPGYVLHPDHARVPRNGHA